ncbi:hypothetical protein [Altererythrobacter aquiaggeris]|uniref:hypothetical protein n=1 Tax=Aestuarierythrobacter aquiaggeris TaxID=1898396 RepID=UPI003015A499
MGLFIVLVIGATQGWLASILTQIEGRQNVVVNVTAGAIGAAAVAVLLAGPSVLQGIALETLFFAIGGSLVSLGIANFTQRTAAN